MVNFDSGLILLASQVFLNHSLLSSSASTEDRSAQPDKKSRDFLQAWSDKRQPRE
jgi:hypothetical protein